MAGPINIRNILRKRNTQTFLGFSFIKFAFLSVFLVEVKLFVRFLKESGTLRRNIHLISRSTRFHLLFTLLEGLFDAEDGAASHHRVDIAWAVLLTLNLLLGLFGRISRVFDFISPNPTGNIRKSAPLRYWSLLIYVLLIPSLPIQQEFLFW